MATEDGRWHPGIGDPTPMGWITVGAYFATAWLCWRWAMAIRRRPDEPDRAGALIFALGLTALLLLLGVNKQLDLQSWFTQVAKDMALTQGWYEQRGSVQVAFVVSMGIGGIAVFGATAWLNRHRLRQSALALFGMVFLLSFVLIRAASFHHMDRLLGTNVAGIEMNWLFELGGIALIALGAAGNLRQLRRSEE